MPATPVTFVTPETWKVHQSALDGPARKFTESAGFEPRAGRHLLLPGPDGAVTGVLFGLEGKDETNKDLFRPGALPGVLPAGSCGGLFPGEHGFRAGP
jgi:leucyl aminopeptidase